MQRMMSSIGQQAGMLQKLPGMKQLAMANKLKDAVQTGGMDNPMMANLADHLLEAAVADGPGGPGGAASARRRVDPSKRKQQRKAQRKARRKRRN